MRQSSLCAALLMGCSLLLAGCGDSVDHRLQRAQIALSSGKPDTALQLADDLLKENANLIDAMLIKAQAQVRLMQLEPARQTIDKLITQEPDNDKARRLMLNWVYFRMGNLLGQSDYASNTTRQEQYDQAMKIGMDQVQWLRTHEKSDVEADFSLARLKLMDVERLSLLISTQGKLIQRGQEADMQNPAGSTAKLENQRKTIRQESLNLLEKVIVSQPRHFEAAQMYARLLTEDNRWDELWTLSQTLTRNDTLPADLVARLTVSLLTMPEGIKPETDLLALCRTMQDKVEQARRSSTDWRLTEARILMKAADHQKALPVLEQLVRDEARNPMARFLLAQCLYHLKEMTKAREILDNLSSEVNSPEVLTLYGLVLMETDDLAVARDVLLRAMELKPEDPSPRRAYLMVQTKANQLEAAGSSVEDYYRKNPADPRAIRFKMQFEQIRNRRDELSTLMNKVQGLRPLTDEHVDILVDGYLFLQDIPSAAQYAQELARRRPDAIEAQLKLAQTLLMQNRDEEVKQLLVKLREKYPESGSADQMLGELYLQRQAFDRSVELMERVVEREPSNLEARFILARGLTGLAFFDEAIEQLDKVLESNPREARAHAMLARIHQATGRREKAAEHLAEINPNEVTESTSPALLAELKMRQGQMEEALDICNRALALGNTDPSIRQILASIYLNQKQYDQAEVNLLGLVRLQPNNAQAYALLTRFYIEQKRVEKGLAEITALQSINEPLSRLTQANLLMSLGRVEDAIERLRPIYEPLLRSRDARAILIADAMARAILVARRDVDAAIAVYDPMIQAGVQSALARLRQIDIHGTRETRPQVIARLESLANEIGPDDKRVRLELIRRLMDAQRFPMAIKLVEDWVSLQPGQNNLLRLKAEVLTRAGQADAAVTVLEQAVALAPEDETVRRQLAAVHVVRYDFPAAQQAYLETSKLDEGARINALADLGQMFVSLGLNAPATDVFARIEKEGRVRDPRAMLSMGRAYMALKKNDLAIQKLEAVPDYASQYASAQVHLAQIEQGTGLPDDARKRLEKLAADPRTAAMATFELLKLNLRTRQAEDLIRWSDQSLAVDTLPMEMRRAWLNIRVLLADTNRDLPLLLTSLDRMAKLYPEAHQLQAAKMLVQIKQGNTEQARVLLQSGGLLGSKFGPLLSAMIGDKVSPSPTIPAVDAYLIAMCQGNPDQARLAIDRMEPIKGVFASDLRQAIERPDAASPEMQLAFRQLAAALIAQRCNLPQMAGDTAAAIIEKHPYLTLAYALETQALLDMEQPTDQLMNKLTRNLPNASVTLYVSALEAGRLKDYTAAVPTLEKLLEREPENQHVRYTLAQTYTMAGKFDQAITILDKLHATPGQHAGAVANDLAYLLAEHRPDRMEEAYNLAKSAVEKYGNSPAILDTLGWVLHLRGNSQESLQPLGRAVAALPNVADVHYHIGSVYQKLGNTDWARYHLEEAARDKENPIAPRAAAALAKLTG